MTLPDVVINMKSVFSCGQAYVALSRAMSLEGLQLTGYHRGLVTADPVAVHYYEELSRNSEIVGSESKQNTSTSTNTSTDITTSIYLLLHNFQLSKLK